MQTLLAFLILVLFCTESASAQTKRQFIFGYVNNISWRYRDANKQTTLDQSLAKTRDVQLCASQGCKWHRLKKEIARKIQRGKYCTIVSEGETILCHNKPNIEPSDLAPLLENLFKNTGFPKILEGNERKQ